MGDVLNERILYGAQLHMGEGKENKHNYELLPQNVVNNQTRVSEFAIFMYLIRTMYQPRGSSSHHLRKCYKIDVERKISDNGYHCFSTTHEH